MANTSALQQAWKGLTDAIKWMSPEPSVSAPAQTIAAPGGFKQAINNVVAAATLRPQLIQPFPQQGLGTNVVQTAKDLVNRIIPGQSFGNTALNPTGLIHPLGRTQPDNTIPIPLGPKQPSSPIPISLSDLLESSKQILAKTTPTETPTPTPTATPTATPTPTPSLTARNPNIGKYQITPPVESAITQAANTFNLPSSILYDIAIGESSLNPSLINTSPEGVAAGNPTGLFQFTDGTWNVIKRYANMPNSSLHLPNDNRLDPLTNALAAAYLISHGQLGRWDASKPSWGQYYKPEELQPYYSQTLGRR